MGAPRRLTVARTQDHHNQTDHAQPSPTPTAVPKRHLYRVPEAMALLSMSRSVIYEQIRAGRLRTVCQGRTRLIPAVAINEYVALLISESEVTYDQPA
ncbi:helix-turn-helix domain-containing protein [Pseudonocardia sp. Cha107L01]|uniref:helix-turn-helix domain-containing protein n=1 Tax=Pseudonocardia sp. Cha107L01 TaxID=3457576 RepID=UPI00403E7F5B